MATLLHHIYSIQNIVNKGIASDDKVFSDRLVAHWLKTARSVLLKQKLDKYHPISDLSFNTLCVPLELTTYSDCNCLPPDLGCQILRSTCKIPQDLVSRHGTSIQIKYLDGTVMSKTYPTQNKWAKYSLAKNYLVDGWFIEDGYVHVVNNKRLPLVLAKAIWEDPEIVANFCTCAGTTDPCYDIQEDNFPIDAELVLPMYELTLKLAGYALGMPKDEENNARSPQTTQVNE